MFAQSPVLPPSTVAPPAANPAAPNQRVRIIRPSAPEPDRVIVRAIHQEAEGYVYRLRGRAELETAEALLTADEVDYNETTGLAEARGNVTYKNYNGGEELKCQRAVYDVNEETGQFYEVSGVIPATIQARPGVLTSNNPFVFEGKWAERMGDRYVLHDGFITSCKLPKSGRLGLFGSGRPWWVLKGPKFDIIPGSRAVANHAMFDLKGLPFFYSPYFYKSLQKSPRKSGFLMPNFGHSSRRGWMYGFGYYWAISRSYDLTYRGQYFTARGPAHLVDFRGKPSQKSDFNFLLYGVNDKGRMVDDQLVKEGGYSINFTGRAELPKGWVGAASINYLSSMRFRQAFTETYYEGTNSEVSSTGVLSKHWNGFGINGIYTKIENYQDANDESNRISIRRLPQVEFFSQDRQLGKKLPFWWSFDSAASLLRRNQPLFQTRQSVERFDFSPRIMTSLKSRFIDVVPYASVRGTYWGSSFCAPLRGGGCSDSPRNYNVTGQGLFRPAFDTGVDIILPSFSRVYKTHGWLGDKFKHVIEPRLSYRYVTGVSDFHRTIRFDETELLTNTNEVEIYVANRFYSKRGENTREWLSWEVWQKRYFDPTFGGALVPGQRNVFETSAALSAFAFLNGPRNYSPIVSSLRGSPIQGLGVEWRMDYDPARHGVTNSAISVDGRLSEVFFSVGHNQVHSDPILTPSANAFRGLIGLGRENKRGWNAAFNIIYDYRAQIIQYANTQVTYNTDCCGFSVQFRRLNWNNRDDYQYRVALAIANIGSFGTLRRQERIGF